MTDSFASASLRHRPAPPPGHPDDTAVGWPGGGAGRCRCSASAEPNDAGFSLIEALVALAILAIATVGLVGAMEQHIDSTRAMERRAAAMWVAENRMAEVGLNDAASEQATQVAMLGERWRVETVRRTTDDPEIARVEVRVYGDGESAPLANLDGFADVPLPKDRRS